MIANSRISKRSDILVFKSKLKLYIFIYFTNEIQVIKDLSLGSERGVSLVLLQEETAVSRENRAVQPDDQLPSHMSNAENQT